MTDVHLFPYATSPRARLVPAAFQRTPMFVPFPKRGAAQGTDPPTIMKDNRVRRDTWPFLLGHV